MANQKGIIVRVPPHWAARLREKFQWLKAHSAAPAKTIQEALLDELINIELRWDDAIGEILEEEKDEAT